MEKTTSIYERNTSGKDEKLFTAKDTGIANYKSGINFRHSEWAIELRIVYEIKYWYSPVIKFWVKREFDKRLMIKDQDALLAGYKLNER